MANCMDKLSKEDKERLSASLSSVTIDTISLLLQAGICEHCALRMLFMTVLSSGTALGHERIELVATFGEAIEQLFDLKLVIGVVDGSANLDKVIEHLEALRAQEETKH